jgi:hypothetical protein
MLRAGDQIWDTSTTTGTGDLTVSGTAPTGYRTLSAMPNIAVGDTFFYAARHRSAAEWETGLGTYSASNTLTRTTVYESSNSNAAVSFSAGTKDVICSFIAGAWRYGAVTPPQGRLTLTSATPVLTADVSAAGTVYYALYTGRIVPLYDGTDFTNVNIGELSNVLANSSTGKAGPAAGAAASVYDLFVWDDAGTNRLTRGPVWTNDTTRAAGTALTRVNGIYLNNASITNGPAASRGTWVGTIRTDAGAATVTLTIVNPLAAGGGTIWVGLWNAYNRIDLDATARDSTASHTYATNTLRAWNGGTGFRATFVRGLDEDGVKVNFNGEVQGASSVTTTIGIGLDSTSARAAGSFGAGHFSSTNELSVQAVYGGLPGLGVHFLQALESASGATSTFYGNYAAGGATHYGSGFSVHLRY